jgi:hypothetical protein
VCVWVYVQEGKCVCVCVGLCARGEVARLASSQG